MVRAGTISSVGYTPGTPFEGDDLERYVNDELLKIAEEIRKLANGHLDPEHVAPSRPREGDMRYADGVNWDPGCGEGVYVFNSSGEWEPMMAKSVTLQDPDDSTRLAEFDSKFKAPLVIQPGHHEIHEGDVYCVGVTSTEGSGSAIEVMLTPPSLPGKEFHTVWEYDASGEGNFSVIEGVTTPTGGVTAAPVNHNRNSANTSSSSNTLTGTDSGTAISYTGGTVLTEEHFGSGKQNGGQRDRGSEWLLKAGVSTIFRLESEVSSNELWLSVRWYEHTEG